MHVNEIISVCLEILAFMDLSSTTVPPLWYTVTLVKRYTSTDQMVVVVTDSTFEF